MTEETIFMVAMEITNPAERAEYVDLVCAGDAPLRERILALLGSHDNPDKFLDARPGEGTQDRAGTASGQAKRAEVKATPISDALAFLAPSSKPGSLGRLDHYEVLEVVGRGGMGVVYKARDSKLQRIVAIKVLAPALAADGTARERFVREARAAAALRDDHVVGIHAVQDTGPTIYLVMEFISGTNLDSKVKKGGPLELKEILRIGMQIASGLAAAHKQGVVHRDIKPANILLENGVQRVKIADFGLARVVNNPNLTQSGMLLGTPLYMAPEQARGESVDHRSDLFSLGSVLYTLCTGTPAFMAGNTMAVLARVCDHTPRPIRDANPDVPDWLVAIVNKLMAKNPASRFQSAAEVAALLGERLAKVQQPGLPTPMPIDRSPVAKRRPLVVAALLIGVLVVVGGVALIASQSFHWGSGGTPNDRPQGTPPVQHPPNVLTVSKDPKHQAHFSTIKDALNAVQADMTIRVLDDAVYDEQILFDNPARHSGVVLEAVGKAQFQDLNEKRQSPNFYVIWIKGVPRVTLRGLRLQGSSKHTNVFITGHCPGLILDRLEIKGLNERDDGVLWLSDELRMHEDERAIIQNCSFQKLSHGITLVGATFTDNSTERWPVGRVVVQNNDFAECSQAVALAGVVYQVMVVGNKIRDSSAAAFDLIDLLNGTKDVAIANNTVLARNYSPHTSDHNALRIWDDSMQGQEFLQCANVRFQSNLIIVRNPELALPKSDLIVLDHDRATFNKIMRPAPPLDKLLSSREWKIGNNWREIDAETVVPRQARWIPAQPGDSLLPRIEVLSRTPETPGFLQPPKGSPLGQKGLNDGVLPAYVGAVPPVGIQEWNWDVTWNALVRKTAPKEAPAPTDPRVITVSKNPKHQAQCSTIKEAMERVKPDMTIRVLDDATYDEQILFDNPAKHKGVMLEAVGNAKFHDSGQRKAPNMYVVWIRGVPNVTLRGLHITGGQQHSHVYVTEQCPGLVLDRLEITGNDDGSTAIAIQGGGFPAEGSEPVEIRNCTLRGLMWGILIEGRDYFRLPVGAFSKPVGRIVVRNNLIDRCGQGVIMAGAVHQTQVVGNKILRTNIAAIELMDLMSGTQDIVVANNSLWSNHGYGFRILDDAKQEHEFLKCKNIRLQNNLLLASQPDRDLVFGDHRRANVNQTWPGDLSKLLKSPDWRLGNNWREIVPPKTDLKEASWIPKCSYDHLLAEIKVLSRIPGQPDFLKPPPFSPLSKYGVNDKTLPPYIGAVPPDGMQEWDWHVTWKALEQKAAAKEDPRVLTVSKNPKHKANYTTIKDALDNVERDMTIRILDDAIYQEPVLIGNPFRHSGLVLEAVGKPRIRNFEKREPGNKHVIWIRGVPNVTLRGLNVVSGAGNPCVYVTGHSPGTLLENLDLTANDPCIGIEVINITVKSGDEPVVVRKCKLTGLSHGMAIVGAHFTKNSVVPLTLGGLVIRDNEFSHCGQTIHIVGDVHNVLIVGNKIHESTITAFDLQDLLKTAKHVLIANNTLVSNRGALRIWSAGDEFLQCKDIRFQNNLILGSRECDLYLFDHAKGFIADPKKGNTHKLLKSTWFLSHNWREIDPETMGGDRDCWIPACLNDQLLGKIEVGRKLGPTYLQPPKDSPLATAGVNNRYLPAYVGAIPPEGMKEWDWSVTWQYLTQKK